MGERYVVQNEDLSDPWNDTAWVTTADGLHYIAGEMTPEHARIFCDALNARELADSQEKRAE